MNCKLILTSLCLLTSYATATLTPEQKTDFLRMYGAYTGVQRDYPDRPTIGVLFFDINGDGVEEAIATYNADMHRDGCLWEVYALIKDEWIPTKLKTDHFSSDPYDYIYAHEHEFFTFTEGNKPPQLITVRDNGKVIKIAFDEDGFRIIKHFSSFDLFDSHTKPERLTAEFHTDIPPPKEEEINPRFLEKFDPETELWIPDPSAIPAPSNGMWQPERTRYFADFNNDEIPDMLLGHGHKGIQPDDYYTLYLRNTKGKYKKHATFKNLYMFGIEKKEKGTALLWRNLWNTPDENTILFGYYIITDKNVSDFVTVKTFMVNENGWTMRDQAFDELSKKPNVQVFNYFLNDSEKSETVGGKVLWMGPDFKRSPEESDETEEGRAKVSPTSRKNKSGIRNENVESENNPNHLWLYAGILFGSLCVAFYFLRRKLKTGN